MALFSFPDIEDAIITPDLKPALHPHPERPSSSDGGACMRLDNYFSPERRREKRVSIMFPATLSWTEDEREVRQQATTFSISNSGAGIIVKRLIPAGKKVFVTLDVGGLSGSAQAEVRWAEESDDRFQIGVSFVFEKPEIFPQIA